jgi:hypothetical protein
MGSPPFRLLATTLLVLLAATSDSPRGAPPLPPARASAGDDSWVEAARGSVAQGSWISEMRASFRVPRAPRSGGQTLYLFPGLQPRVGRTILQPVLRYSTEGWSIFSERAHRVGDRDVELRSAVVPTATGHWIVGRMRSSACNRAGACTWTITTSDLTSGESTTLTEEDLTPYSRYFAGVLEAYGVYKCSQYPDEGSIEFVDVSVYDEDGDPVPVAYDDWVRPGIDPWCHFGTSRPPAPPFRPFPATRNAVTLYFGAR